MLVCYRGRRFSTTSLSKFSASLSSFIIVSLLVGLSQGADAKKQLLVAAASDLSGLESPLREAFERQTGYRVRFTSGASGSLARQIESGAPYDVFLSADEGRVKALADAGHVVSKTVVVYALGRVALWSKGGQVHSLEDLLRPGVLHVAIANPAHAPYGMAAKEVLQSRGLWDALQPRIVYGESVRQALQFAASGNAEAALVAWSLVFGQGGILLPAEWHKPIRQAAGVVTRSEHGETALRLVQFLMSAEGRRLLDGQGFSTVKEPVRR